MAATDPDARFAPLQGIRVLDLSKILAGPLCTQYLGELGASVDKIESREAGDDTRLWPPFTDGNGTVFLSVNRNKRSLALDLKSPRGLAIVKRLAASADVVVESFSPGAAERLGVGYESLRAVNPRIVYCSISGFGPKGPMRDGRGYDVILQAFCGMLSITGEPGGPPVRAAYSPVDQATGLHAVIGILAGLRERDRTGVGVNVQASLFDSATSFLGYVLQAYWQRGVDPQPAGSGHESLCPYQAFETRDKPIILGVANDALWRRFCALAGLPDLAEDPRFRTGAARVANRDETVRITQDVLRRRRRSEWLSVLDEAGIPCSPVHSIGELTRHPHFTASGMAVTYPSAQGNAVNGVAIPLYVDDRRLRHQLRPPEHGEHTREILGELGLADDEIERLVREGVVGREG